MTLFLNGNQEYIPVKVPALSPQQAKKAMPRRHTNPKAEVAGLSSGAEEVAKAGVDEYAAREAELCDLQKFSKLGGFLWE